MDKKQIAILNLKHATHEADFLLSQLLGLYESVKYNRPIQNSDLSKISYLFNAFVRAGKSVLELIAKISEKGKKGYLTEFSENYNQNYLMKTARDLITHGSGDLIPGAVEINSNGKNMMALVCSPISEDGKEWIAPPHQDSISLAIDYFLGILDETEKLYESVSKLPESYWHGVRQWELEVMRASIHVSLEVIELFEHLQSTLPQGLVPDLIETTWVSSMATKYKSLRTTTYPTVIVSRGAYNLSPSAYPESQTTPPPPVSPA